jgi:hypothetical protein
MTAEVTTSGAVQPTEPPTEQLTVSWHRVDEISKEQLAGDFPVWQTSLVDPDRAESARLCGATGLTARALSEVDAAVSDLLSSHRPTPRDRTIR